MLQRFKAYLRVAAIAAREDGANPKRIAVAVTQQLLRVLLIVAIYRVAYEVSPNHALSFQNAMWTIGISFAFFLNLGIRNLYIPMERDITSGNVEVNLIKPLDWRWVKLAHLLGINSLEFALQIIVMPTALFLLVGPPDVSHLTGGALAMFGMFFVLSTILSTMLFACVGMSAFWFNDAKSTFRIVDKMALIFCGTFVPIALLPAFIQQALFFTPFSIYAAPVQIFDPTFLDRALPTLISGLIWVPVMIAACQFIWYRANRKVEVNGG